MASSERNTYAEDFSSSGYAEWRFGVLPGLLVTSSLLAFASNTATAAHVCIGGHFHYGGSGGWTGNANLWYVLSRIAHVPVGYSVSYLPATTR
jgi:hypothetical protein